MNSNEQAYLVFDNDLDARDFAGASYDFFEACKLAFERQTAIIFKFHNLNLEYIAKVDQGDNWYFKPGSPYNPKKYQDGQAVRYRYGSRTRIGEIEYGLVNFEFHGKPDYPRADMSTHRFEIQYVINDEWEDESQIIEVISEPEIVSNGDDDE